MDEPIFTKRSNEQKYQVRFWSTKKDYDLFVAAVKKEGLVIQDVLDGMMLWFISASASGKLQVKDPEKTT